MRGITSLSAKTVCLSNVPSPFVSSCLEMRLMGGLQVKIDGVAVEPAKSLQYKGMMFSDIPNLESDFYHRTIGELPRLEAAFRATSADNRALLTGFVAGYNRYLRDHRQVALLGRIIPRPLSCVAFLL